MKKKSFVTLETTESGILKLNCYYWSKNIRPLFALLLQGQVYILYTMNDVLHQ